MVYPWSFKPTSIGIIYQLIYYTVLSKNSWQKSFANSMSNPVVLLFIIKQNQEMLDCYQQHLNQLLYRWQQAWWKSKTAGVWKSQQRNRKETKFHLVKSYKSTESLTHKCFKKRLSVWSLAQTYTEYWRGVIVGGGSLSWDITAGKGGRALAPLWRCHGSAQPSQ